MPLDRRRFSTSPGRVPGRMMRQHSRGSRSSGDQIPVQPTPDLQEIYNEMRELEEQLTEQLTRESLSQVPDGRAAALCPSSPSQATTPSLAETVSSTARGIDDTDTGARSPGGNVKRGRHGPLSKVKRLKANLMRKIKACDECRERRVECTHRNLDLFEQEYQRRKRAREAAAAAAVADRGAITRPYNPAGTLPPQDAPVQPRELSHVNDLAGITGGTTQAQGTFFPNPWVRIHHGNEDTHPEIDPLEGSQLAVRQDLARFLAEFPNVNTAACSYTAADTPAIPFLTVTPPQPIDNREILIGRESAPGSAELVCQGSCEIFGRCPRSFTDLPSLISHFSASHFHVFDPFLGWCCARCRTEADEERPTRCNACTEPEPESWLRCCWASVGDPSAGYRSNLPGHVPSYGSSSARRFQQPNFSSFGPSVGGYSSSPTGSSGSYWGYSYGGGGGQTHYAPSPKALQMATGSRSRASSPSWARATLPFLGYFSPLSCFGTRAPEERPPGFARRVCPAAIVLVVFALAPLLGRWTSPPASPALPALDGVGVGVMVPIDGTPPGIPRSTARGRGLLFVPELSMICVIAGLAVPLLFGHIRDRWRGGRPRPSRGPWVGPPLPPPPPPPSPSPSHKARQPEPDLELHFEPDFELGPRRARARVQAR